MFSEILFPIQNNNYFFKKKKHVILYFERTYYFVLRKKLIIFFWRRQYRYDVYWRFGLNIAIGIIRIDGRKLYIKFELIWVNYEAKMCWEFPH